METIVLENGTEVQVPSDFFGWPVPKQDKYIEQQLASTTSDIPQEAQDAINEVKAQGEQLVDDLATQSNVSATDVIDGISDLVSSEGVQTAVEEANVGEQAGSVIGGPLSDAAGWIKDNILQPYGEAMLIQSEVEREGYEQLGKIIAPYVVPALETAADIALLYVVIKMPAIPPQYKGLATLATALQFSSWTTPTIVGFINGLAKEFGFEGMSEEYINQVAANANAIRQYLPRTLLLQGWASARENVKKSNEPEDWFYKLGEKVPTSRDYKGDDAANKNKGGRVMMAKNMGGGGYVKKSKSMMKK